MDKMEILTPLQKTLLQHLFSDEWFRRYFYLTGGTALSAFYYQHRYSEDLVFFSHDIDLSGIPNLIDHLGKKMNVSVERVQTTPGFMRFLLDKELKVDIVADISFRIGSPVLMETFMVDSLKNIAVNKVGCLLSRLDAKDYVDLYWILNDTNYDIFELFELGKQKDGGLEPFIWASLISDAEKLKNLPKMIKTLSLEELQDFFLKLRDKILDRINPKKSIR